MKEKVIPNKRRTKVLQIVDLGKLVILKIVGLKRAYEYSKIYGTVCLSKRRLVKALLDLKFSDQGNKNEKEKQ
jgi:hypothetical protein